MRSAPIPFDPSEVRQQRKSMESQLAAARRLAESIMVHLENLTHRCPHQKIDQGTGQCRDCGHQLSEP